MVIIKTPWRQVKEKPSAGLPLSPSDSLGEFILQAVPLTYAYILIGFFASLPIKCLYLEMI